MRPPHTALTWSLEGAAWWVARVTRFCDRTYRDTPADRRASFVVADGHYVSAPRPGDAHEFASRFAALLTTG